MSVANESAVPSPSPSALQAVVGEVEGHVAEAGWDQPPQLFALVPTEALLAAEPQLARTVGLVAGDPSALTPIAQEPLADAPLDEALGSVVFGREVLGVVLAHEVVVLPPAAEAVVAASPDPVAAAAASPDRREVRMVVGVARGGESATVLRLRGDRQPDATDPDSAEPDAAEPDDLLTGPGLAPGLAAALLATLED